MVYLETFRFPDAEWESSFLLGQKRTCYTSFYPFKILSRHGFERIDCAPLTILYGGNGCGKSTALHVIAQRAQLSRGAAFNSSAFFEDYVHACKIVTHGDIPAGSRIITSDDVFDAMLDVRALNEGMDRKREEIFEDYWREKRSGFQMSSMADYEQLRRVNRARHRTQSRYTREELGMNVRTFSNGENAFKLFTDQIGENALYLLDEPENSLSPIRVQELAQFIEDSMRFFGCQFILSTHSPFLLALRGAKIYDLDSDPVTVRHWTQLQSVRMYQAFFEQHRAAFLEETEE